MKSVLIAAATVAAIGLSHTSASGTTLDKVKERGMLACGSNPVARFLLTPRLTPR